MDKLFKRGTLRLFWHPNLPSKSNFFYMFVNSVEEAGHSVNILAEYDDFLLSQEFRKDYSNTVGLEVFKNGKWEDWESSDGTPFDEYWSDYEKISREHTEGVEEGSFTFSVENKEMLKLSKDGKIYVRGKLVDDNKQVVDALRQFLKASGALLEED